MKKMNWFYDKKGNVHFIEVAEEKTKVGAIGSGVGFSMNSGGKIIKMENKKAA